MDAHKNFAYSTVATAPSPATSGTSLTVASGDGALFPAAPFNATVWPASTQPSASNAEIVRVTDVSGDTLTITRSEESSSARTIVVGDQIAATITAKTLTDAEAAIGWKLWTSEDGTSFTNWSSSSGTWASDGTTINQTSTATNTQQRVVLKTPLPGIYLAQIEFMLPSSGQPSLSGGSDIHTGVLVGVDKLTGVGDGYPIMRAVGTAGSPATGGSFGIESDGISGRLSVTQSWTIFDTWHTLRVLWNGVLLTGWYDIGSGPQLVGTAGSFSNNNTQQYLGMAAYEAVVSYRNLKVWAPDFDSIAAL